MLLSLIATTQKVIRLDEIKIVGDVERPTVSFVIARAPFDFLDGSVPSEKKNLIGEIADTVKSDIFEVR